jgi:diaminopimelate epimerase
MNLPETQGAMTIPDSQQYARYQALGNDMVVLDPATFTLPLTPAAIRLICDRHLGLGADGICYGPLSGPRPRAMRFFNPDGSESEKSGNGLRVFARYLWDQGVAPGRDFDVWIAGEQIEVRLEDEAASTLTTALGRLSFYSSDIPVAGPPREVVEEERVLPGATRRITAVTIGNPHCVLFQDMVSAAEARRLGPAIERDPLFPNRTNVQFAQVLDEHTLRIEIWERGVGYTLASGTSAAAVAGAAMRTGRGRSPLTIHMAGGSVAVAIDENWQVSLTGPVAAVCRGTLAREFVERIKE